MSELLHALSKIAQSLLLPPTSLLLLALLCLVFARRRRWAAWLGGVSLFALLVLSTPAVGLALRAALEARVTPLVPARLGTLAARDTMIVILGGGRRLHAPEFTGGETLGAATLARCRYGATLARASGLPVAVTGGKPDGGRHSEGALMADFLAKELGQKVSLVEEESRDTRENAVLTQRALAGLGIRRVVLVTDAVHMPRARVAFEAQNLEVVAAPTGFEAGRALSAVDFIPSASGLWLASTSLREHLGAAVYRLR
ncbi:MAG TPA: YdcF family protein [Burkholderiales bacterium]